MVRRVSNWCCNQLLAVARSRPSSQQGERRHQFSTSRFLNELVTMDPRVLHYGTRRKFNATALYSGIEGPEMKYDNGVSRLVSAITLTSEWQTRGDDLILSPHAACIGISADGGDGYLSAFGRRKKRGQHINGRWL